MSESQKELEALLAEARKSSNTDKDYGAIKASISLIPVIGGPAAEFFSTYVTSPSQNRLNKFLAELIKELGKLETQVDNFSCESLREDESFQTMLIQSVEIAKRTHQYEKIKALKNLLLNSVLQNSIADDVKLLFLDWIDELKETQFYLLDVLDNPDKHMEKDSDFNNLKEQPYLYDVFLKELIDKKIVALAKVSNSASEGIIEHHLRSNQLEEAIRALLNRIKELESLDIHLARGIIRSKIPTNLITPLGELFIKFIKSPIKDDPQ